MKILGNLKIKNKLIAIILSVTILILAVAFTSILIYEKTTRLASLHQQVKNLARFAAQTLGSALTLEADAEEIESEIKILKNMDVIKNLYIYDETGEVVYKHVSEKTKPIPRDETDKTNPYVTQKGRYIHVAQPVIYVEENESSKYVGMLYLIASTKELDTQLQRLLYFMVMLVLVLIVLSVILANKLQAIISKPILNLVAASRTISTEGNYELRVQKENKDEIGRLYDAFNEMMEQILNRDIERDRVESQLKSARFFLGSVIDSMPSLLITIEEDGEITQWNKAAAALTEISDAEAVGKNLWELLPSFIEFKERINQISATDKSLEFYKELITIAENPFYFNGSIFPLLDAGIDKPSFVIVLHNVTDLEVKERQLRQSQKMETVGNLAGGLAHDFNNVLGGIIGTISLFKYKSTKSADIPKPEIEKYFNTMEEAANRASDMVQHLLSLTRKQELSFTPTDLNATIKSIVKICKNTFDKGIDIETNYFKEKAVTYADPTQMEQSLLNLCINAAHAMTIMREDVGKYGGILNISLRKIQADKHFRRVHPEAADPEYWDICVSDTGVGMDPKTVTRIFDPFFTTKREGTGTGLGLAMVYNIIKRHKGVIDVYSQEGTGTTFHIYLPVFKGSFIEDDLLKKEEIRRGEGVVLVVDDEEVMRQTARSILMECGYTVLLAENGLEAIEIYRDYKDDIKAVLLDMVMPKMSGRQTYIELANIDEKVKVLLVSGFKLDHRVESILRLGVKGFIQKPYTLKTLANRLHRLIYEEEQF